MCFCRHMVLSTLIILVQKLFSKQQNTRALKNALKWPHAAQSLKKKHHKMSLKTLWQFLKKLNTNLTYNPAIPLVAIYPRELKT